MGTDRRLALRCRVRMSLRPLLILLLAGAVLSCAPTVARETREGSDAARSEATPVRNKRPYPEIAYTRGPALVPKDALVTWLDKLGARKLVRLPVMVRFTGNKLGIEGGTAGELELTLADAGLGVSLHDHA